MYNLTKLCKTVIVGNGEELECNLKGDLKLHTIDGDKERLTIMLSNVLYVPRLKANLCSLSRITEIAGTKVNLTTNSVVVKKEREDSIKLFSREESGNLYNMKCVREEVEEHALLSKEKIDINVLHKRLGHLCYEYTKKTVSLYGLMWKGVPEICAGCAMGKGQQKALKKHTENRSKVLILIKLNVSTWEEMAWMKL